MSQAIDTEGKRLKYIREKILNVSQETFAAPIAKHATAIQKWESGLHSIDPSVKLLMKHVYGINPVWLDTGNGEIMLEGRSLNGFQMSVYALSGKPYADLFKEDNIITGKIVIHTGLAHDLANIFLLAAAKATVGIEKDDLLVVSSNCNKDKSPKHYLVEENGISEIRLLKYAKNGIIEINDFKTSKIRGFPFKTDNVLLEESQIKGEVIKIFASNLWEDVSAISI